MADDYMKFTGHKRFSKQFSILKGMLRGIVADSVISNDEIVELFNWCTLNKEFERYQPFRTIIPKIEEACADGEVSDDELADILWVVDNIERDDIIYDLQTSVIQNLNGIMHGILADGIINDSEIVMLKNWINDFDFLKGTYPYDEIDSILVSIFKDGIISEDERKYLAAVISDFIDMTSSNNLIKADFDQLRKEYTIGGICAVNPDVEIENKLFCFTGESTRTKKEIEKIIIENSGKYSDNLKIDTDYLVVGSQGNQCWAFSCYGRKVEQAHKMRKKGGKIQIINEIDFWDSI